MRHVLAVRSHQSRDDPDPVLRAVAVRLPGNHERDREAFDVPFERCVQGLVEVIDPEEEIPLGRGQEAEIEQVAVAAGLDTETACRRRGKVLSH